MFDAACELCRISVKRVELRFKVCRIECVKGVECVCVQSV